MYERSVTDHLFDLGVTHRRDAWSSTDGKHELFYAGRMIGRFSALDVSIELEESGLLQDKCPSCGDAIECWWSYCAMCGWHIASGASPIKTLS